MDSADSVVAADSVMVVEEPYADSVAVFEEPEQEPEQELVSLPKSTSEEIYEGHPSQRFGIDVGYDARILELQCAEHDSCGLLIHD